MNSPHTKKALNQTPLRSYTTKQHHHTGAGTMSCHFLPSITPFGGVNKSASSRLIGKRLSTQMLTAREKSLQRTYSFTASSSLPNFSHASAHGRICSTEESGPRLRSSP